MHEEMAADNYEKENSPPAWCGVTCLAIIVFVAICLLWKLGRWAFL